MQQQQIINREHWLTEAITLLSPIFTDYSIPMVRVTCGWPSANGRSTKRRRLGECWYSEATADKLPQLFITPMESDSLEVLGILVHELSHTIAGKEAKHKGEFVKIIKAVGLEGKPTATYASDALKLRLQALVVDEIGEYPHAALTPELQEKKEGTRLLKVTCTEDNCGATYRITQKWIDFAEDGLTCAMNGCAGEVEVEQKE